MFLHLLSKPEKETFAAAVELVINSDAVLHEREVELKAALEAELEVSWPTGSIDWSSVEPELRRVSSSVSRRVMLLELCGVACADLELHEDEVALLTDIADALKLSDRLSMYLDFAPRAHAIRAEAESLILDADSEHQA
jgi:hypothetical protein